MSDYGEIIEQYDALRERSAQAIKDDKSLMGDDAWLPRPYAGDIEYMTATEEGLVVQGKVWTMQTGGSSEHFEFTIPWGRLSTG